jgi:hypothetical protein
MNRSGLSLDGLVRVKPFPSKNIKNATSYVRGMQQVGAEQLKIDVAGGVSDKAPGVGAPPRPRRGA